jgi:DNA primase
MANEHLEPIISQMPAGAYLEILAQYNPRLNGESLALDCPSCKGKTEAYIYVGSKKGRCNRRNACNQTFSIWDILQAQEGLDNAGTLRRLAELAGYVLPELGPEAIRHLEEARRREGILEAALSFFQDKMKGSEAWDYMTARRGWTLAEIEAAGLGYYPGWDKTAAHLAQKGFKQEEIAGALWRDREAYKVVIPWFRPGGGVKSLHGRILGPGDDKYKPLSRDAKKDTPINWENAQRERKIYLVEGMLDALHMESIGIKGAAGIGTAAKLNDEILKLIRDSKAETVLLCLDGDQAGQKATEKIIPQVLECGKVCLALCIPPDLKDPDGYIVAKGPDAFKEALRTAPQWMDWLAEYTLLDKHKDAKTVPESHALAQRDILELAAKVPDPTARERILDAAADFLDITRASLKEKEAMHREARAREEARAKAQASTAEALEAFKAGDVVAGRQILDQLGRDFQAEERKKLPSITFAQALEAKIAEDMTRDYNAPLGHCLKGFPKLQERFDGLQSGLYLFGAKSNVGKSMLLVSLFFALLEAEGNDQVHGIYLTLDDSKKETLSRFLGLASSLNKSQARKPNFPSNKPKVAAGKARLDALAHRITLFDQSEIQTIAQIDALIQAQKERGPVAVFIDALFNVQVPSTYQDRRSENVDRAQLLKAMQTKYGIPLVGTGEVTKAADPNAPDLDNFMESGKYGYNADFVGMLAPMEGKDALYRDEYDLFMNIPKNKLGLSKHPVRFNVNKKAGTFQESTTDISAEDIAAAQDGKSNGKPPAAKKVAYSTSRD